MVIYKIAVVGTGYVGLRLAMLLSQNREVIVVDVIEDKVNMLKTWRSPIQDMEIETYLNEHEKRQLKLSATLDAKKAYSDANIVVLLKIGLSKTKKSLEQ